MLEKQLLQFIVYIQAILYITITVTTHLLEAVHCFPSYNGFLAAYFVRLYFLHHPLAHSGHNNTTMHASLHKFSIVFVGDKINPRGHVDPNLETSQSYISDICYEPVEEDRLGIITSRSYRTQ
jgi:hypothetical protein